MIAQIRAFITKYWLSLSDSTREKIISAWHTFLTVFITVAVATVQTGHIEWTWSFWSAVAGVAFRMGIKAAWVIIMPPTLGGIRGVKPGQSPE